MSTTSVYEIKLQTTDPADVLRLIDKRAKVSNPFVRKLIDRLEQQGITLADTPFGDLKEGTAYVSRYTGPLDDRRKREIYIEVRPQDAARHAQLLRIFQGLPDVAAPVRRDHPHSPSIRARPGQRVRPSPQP
jgi:DNA-binding MarR family transcriptional regulator